VALQSKTSVLDFIATDTAIIYPVVFKDRLELLVTLSNTGIKQYSIDISSDKLNENIQKFRNYLEKRTTTQFKQYAKNLYDIIIKPIEQDLEKNSIKSLVIVPESFLRTIPLAALFDGSKFLVEKYAISVTPGLTLTDPQKFETKNISVLIGGITESVEGFPALPAVNEEVKAINNLYSSVILKDHAFTKKNIEDNLTKKEFSVVHIASHGLFEGNINNTFILAYDGRISLTDLQDLMFINIYRDKPIELLTLSACDTAAGDERAALGLAGIAIKAGARSAFATLWEVSDIATSQIVANFYKNLSGGNSKSESLRKAQIALINDENFNHPYYWSPFLIIGNWL
jgi:CHAT domain-containing protein